MLFTRTNIIRYLFVLQVNNSLVWLPKTPSVEFSRILGNAILERLPTIQARPWKKALKSWDDLAGPKKNSKKNEKFVPPNPWPIDAILFWYPTKQTFGEKEFIFLEIKLLGKDADHGLFMEIILPSIEEIGISSRKPWVSQTSLWGHFEIHSVFTAKGHHWKPLIKNGRLDLRYKVHPSQWSRGLKFEPLLIKNRKRLTWLTPFHFSELHGNPEARRRNAKKKAPSMKTIIEALLCKLAKISLGKNATVDDYVSSLNNTEKKKVMEALSQAKAISIRSILLEKVPAPFIGSWIGTQNFGKEVPETLLPFLGLASIVHIGDFVHYGSGCFIMD